MLPLIRQTLEGMEKVHPQVEEHYQKAYVQAWKEDPYTLGGNSWPAPGDAISMKYPSPPLPPSLLR